MPLVYKCRRYGQLPLPSDNQMQTKHKYTAYQLFGLYHPLLCSRRQILQSLSGSCGGRLALDGNASEPPGLTPRISMSCSQSRSGTCEKFWLSRAELRTWTTTETAPRQEEKSRAVVEKELAEAKPVLELVPAHATTDMLIFPCPVAKSAELHVQDDSFVVAWKRAS